MTNPNGILLCGIAGCGLNEATAAVFNGYTLTGTTISTTATLPPYNQYAMVTMGNMWQPLRSITIVNKVETLSCGMQIQP